MKRVRNNTHEDPKNKFKTRKFGTTGLVRGVNSADLNIYLSKKNGNPNKERHDKHFTYNNLKDNSKITTFTFMNEIIKVPEPIKKKAAK
jgi:hypothetical protein